MTVLLLRLSGPLQSWGTQSRFDDRDTGLEPSKSGVIGLLAAARGLDRDNWNGIKPMTKLVFGVRRDRPGMPMRDFQTAAGADGRIMRAKGSLNTDNNGIVSQRHYLADAVFLAGVEGDPQLLGELSAALRNPVWPLFLGRKSYVPAKPVWLPDGLREGTLLGVLSAYPWLGRKNKFEKPPTGLLCFLDSPDGSGGQRLDVPAGSFQQRNFVGRFVKSYPVTFPGEQNGRSSSDSPEPAK
jgi:CRISPR system Cascade subunit CasD